MNQLNQGNTNALSNGTKAARTRTSWNAFPPRRANSVPLGASASHLAVLVNKGGGGSGGGGVGGRVIVVVAVIICYIYLY